MLKCKAILRKREIMNSKSNVKNKEISDAIVHEEDSPVLTIKNFSCIKLLTVKFKRIVVFIGEQASGKSVTCKLYYFFTQALKKVAVASLQENLDVEGFKKHLLQEFYLIFPETTWKNDTFSIEWEFGTRHMKVSHNRGTKKVRLDLCDHEDRYVDALKKVRLYTSHQDKDDDFDFRWRMRDVVRKAFAVNFQNLQVDYIPAGRSFFSTIQDTVFSLLSNNVGIDYFLKEFGRLLESFKRTEYFENRSWGSFENLCKPIIHGKYLYDGKEQWLISDENHKVRLADASSGQQEALPLLMFLMRLGRVARNRGGMSRILIEEPEAHLYPTAQQRIIDMIAEYLKTNGEIGSIITTHSPFILCCLNNVLKKSVNLRHSVSAYHLHDGVGDKIYDEELGLINAERFDDISLEIANA